MTHLLPAIWPYWPVRDYLQMHHISGRLQISLDWRPRC
jgi:hypothetical protein